MLGFATKKTRDEAGRRKADQAIVANREKIKAEMRDVGARHAGVTREVAAGRMAARELDVIENALANCRHQLNLAASAEVRLRQGCPDEALVRRFRALNQTQGPLATKEAAMARDLLLERGALAKLKENAQRQRDALGGKTSIGQPVTSDPAYSSLAEEVASLDRQIANRELDIEDRDEALAAVQQERVELAEQLEQMRADMLTA